MGIFKNFFNKIFARGTIDTASLEKNIKTAPNIDPIKQWSIWPLQIHEKSGQKSRLDSALWIDETTFKVEQDKATFYGSDTIPYETSLRSCTCKDFIKNKTANYPAPCKHMYRLAIELKLIDGVVKSKEVIEKAKALEYQYNEKLKKCTLTEDQIQDILGLLSASCCYVSLEEWDNPDKDFEDFYKKEIRAYQNKLEVLTEKLDGMTDLAKIENLVIQINQHIHTFKKFCYDKGSEGQFSYDTFYQDDLDFVRGTVSDYLRNWYPEALLEWQEEQAYKKLVKSIEKQILEKLKKESPLVQAHIIKTAFIDNKREAMDAIDNLVEKGKITRYKKGRYFLELSK